LRFSAWLVARQDQLCTLRFRRAHGCRSSCARVHVGRRPPGHCRRRRRGVARCGPSLGVERPARVRL